MREEEKKKKNRSDTSMKYTVNQKERLWTQETTTLISKKPMSYVAISYIKSEF